MIQVDFSQGYASPIRTIHRGDMVSFDDTLSLYQQCKDVGLSAEQAETFESGLYYYRLTLDEGKPGIGMKDRDMALQMVYGQPGKAVVDEQEAEADKWREALGDADPLEAIVGATEAIKRTMFLADMGMLDEEEGYSQ